MSWVIWITGLPGCGKSTVALSVKDRLPDTVILNMDRLREVVTPEPNYSGSERDYVYRSLTYLAKTVSELGHNVILDATGNRKVWRSVARKLIPEFFEVYLACPLQLCMERERARRDTHGAPADIYDKAGQGASVPGVNVEYEVPEDPELIIDTEKLGPDEAAVMIIKMLQKRGGVRC